MSIDLLNCSQPQKSLVKGKDLSVILQRKLELAVFTPLQDYYWSKFTHPSCVIAHENWSWRDLPMAPLQRQDTTQCQFNMKDTSMCTRDTCSCLCRIRQNKSTLMGTDLGGSYVYTE